MKVTKQYLRQLRAAYDVAKGSYNFCVATKGTEKEITHYREQMEKVEQMLNEAKQNLPGNKI